MDSSAATCYMSSTKTRTQTKWLLRQPGSVGFICWICFPVVRWDCSLPQLWVLQAGTGWSKARVMKQFHFLGFGWWVRLTHGGSLV